MPGRSAFNNWSTFVHETVFGHPAAPRPPGIRHPLPPTLPNAFLAALADPGDESSHFSFGRDFLYQGAPGEGILPDSRFGGQLADIEALLGPMPFAIARAQFDETAFCRRAGRAVVRDQRLRTLCAETARALLRIQTWQGVGELCGVAPVQPFLLDFFAFETLQPAPAGRTYCCLAVLCRTTGRKRHTGKPVFRFAIYDETGGVIATTGEIEGLFGLPRPA